VKSAAMLQRGDSVPHFEARTVGGESFSYSTIWQRRNLVLVALPAEESEVLRSYVSRVTARQAEFSAMDAECVLTRDRVSGVPSPGVVVADRWGEVVHVAFTPRVDGLPSPEELLDWLDYLDRRCPECEGEAK
jgi:hypothetical protein